MIKTSKKSINYGLKILVILAFGLIFTPFNTASAAYGTNVGDYFVGYREVTNPVPAISSIEPNSSEKNTYAKNILITGDGFIPNSVARVNGSNRSTTFIDYSHLLIQLNTNDMYRNNGFFISVFNGEPGGGYSNAILFTLKNTAVASNTGNNNNSNNSYSNNDANNTSANTNQNVSDENGALDNLASSVILGSSTSFLPSGLVQWILLAIIILVIVILARKVFGAEENYHASPMKHA